ncbi:MAG: T9SS type A sorting domain-containing protein, partial [Bacteroidota bacterium]
QGFANVYSVSVGEVRERPEVGLFPNPVTAGTEVRFTGLAPEVRDYVVYDQSGRSLLRGQTSTDGQLLLPTELPRGMVVVRLGMADGTSLVRRLLVR